jgi:DNA polymerase (family 10)
MMSINPDAHSTTEIDLTHWGVEMARKGGVPRERVLNCLELPQFTDYLNVRRSNGRRIVQRKLNKFQRPTRAPQPAKAALPARI